MSLRVAVLGAGIQGTCAALALAGRGLHVDLIDQAAQPITQASRWNEGKIHLGFVYAKDKSGQTTDTMVRGALTFDTALQRLTGRWRPADLLSTPFHYVVHRASQLSVDAISAHFATITERYRALRALMGEKYFGADSDFVWERLPDREMAAHYDPRSTLAAFRTIELSVNPAGVADMLRQAVSDQARVQFLGAHRIERVDTGPTGQMRISIAGQGSLGPYDHVVNALWQDRMRIDASIGLRPHRRWLHRYKLAVHIAGASGPRLPSATIVLGEYGDIVDFGGGCYYLSWYPACKLGEWQDLQPPPVELSDEIRSRVLDRTLGALAKIVPASAALDLSRAKVEIEGGYIFAWAKTDISDPMSELHSRSDIGIRSQGRFHSIDTGKYCMAPYFAEMLADRICGAANQR
jgi:glycine/D-amino acid oxidase-like deaminating enzyme